MKKYPQIESFDGKRIVIVGNNLYIENIGNDILISNERENPIRAINQKYWDGDKIHCDFCKNEIGEYKNGYDLKDGVIQKGQGTKGKRFLNFCGRACVDGYANKLTALETSK